MTAARRCSGARTHTHTLMHTVSVYILLHARIYVVYEEPQIKALLVLIDRTQSKQIL